MPKAVLDMRVDNELYHSKNLSTEMECIAKPTFLALLRGQRLDWFQIEVVVEVEEVQVLPMDEQVEHVVPLATHL